MNPTSNVNYRTDYVIKSDVGQRSKRLQHNDRKEKHL